MLARGEVVPQRVHFEDLVVECVAHLDGLAFSRDEVEVAAEDDGEAVVARGKPWGRRQVWDHCEVEAARLHEGSLVVLLDGEEAPASFLCGMSIRSDAGTRQTGLPGPRVGIVKVGVEFLHEVQAHESHPHAAGELCVSHCGSVMQSFFKEWRCGRVPEAMCATFSRQRTKVHPRAS